MLSILHLPISLISYTYVRYLCILYTNYYHRITRFRFCVVLYCGKSLFVRYIDVSRFEYYVTISLLVYLSHFKDNLALVHLHSFVK